MTALILAHVAVDRGDERSLLADRVLRTFLGHVSGRAGDQLDAALARRGTDALSGAERLRLSEAQSLVRSLS